MYSEEAIDQIIENIYILSFCSTTLKHPCRYHLEGSKKQYTIKIFDCPAHPNYFMGLKSNQFIRKSHLDGKKTLKREVTIYPSFEEGLLNKVVPEGIYYGFDTIVIVLDDCKNLMDAAVQEQTRSKFRLLKKLGIKPRVMMLQILQNLNKNKKIILNNTEIIRANLQQIQIRRHSYPIITCFNPQRAFQTMIEAISKMPALQRENNAPSVYYLEKVVHYQEQKVILSITVGQGSIRRGMEVETGPHLVKNFETGEFYLGPMKATVLSISFEGRELQVGCPGRLLKVILSYGSNLQGRSIDMSDKSLLGAVGTLPSFDREFQVLQNRIKPKADEKMNGICLKQSREEQRIDKKILKKHFVWKMKKSMTSL